MVIYLTQDGSALSSPMPALRANSLATSVAAEVERAAAECRQQLLEVGINLGADVEKYDKSIEVTPSETGMLHPKKPWQTDGKSPQVPTIDRSPSREG